MSGAYETGEKVNESDEEVHEPDHKVQEPDNLEYYDYENINDATAELTVYMLEDPTAIESLLEINPRYEGFQFGIKNKANDAFVHLFLFDTNEHSSGDEIKKNPLDGWKFHLSVDESDPDNIAKAWDIVTELALKYKIGESKFLKSDKFLATRQSGKELTIYINDDDPELDWNTILLELNQKFVANNIKPGVAPFGDKPIRGSSYISYRFDPSSDQDNYANSADTGFQYLPIDKINDDPFQHIFVQEEHQVLPKTRAQDIQDLLERYHNQSDEYGFNMDIKNIKLYIEKINEIDSKIKEMYAGIGILEQDIVAEESQPEKNEGKIQELKQIREAMFKELYSGSKDLVAYVDAIEKYFAKFDEIIFYKNFQKENAALISKLASIPSISDQCEIPLANIDELYTNLDIARQEFFSIEQEFHTEPSVSQSNPKWLGEYFSEIEERRDIAADYFNALDEIVNIKLNSNKYIALIEKQLLTGKLDATRGNEAIKKILEINQDVDEIYKNIKELKPASSENSKDNLKAELTTLQHSTQYILEIISDLSKAPEEVYKEVHNEDVGATLREYNSPRFGTFR